MGSYSHMRYTTRFERHGQKLLKYESYPDLERDILTEEPVGTIWHLESLQFLFEQSREKSLVVRVWQNTITKTTNTFDAAPQALT